MKKLEWFKTDVEVPDNAVYIKTENKIVRYEEDYDPMGGVTIPIYEEFHLYEIQVPKAAS